MDDLSFVVLKAFCLVGIVTAPLVALKRRLDHRALSVLAVAIAMIVWGLPAATIAACELAYGSCHFVPPVPMLILTLFPPSGDPLTTLLFALPAFFGRRKAPLGTLPRRARKR